jgi:putative transposase
LITPHNLYVKLGKTPSKRQARYSALLDGHMPSDTLDEISSATNKAWALGDFRFKQQVEDATGRAASPRKCGGDKKSEKFWEEMLVTQENS